MRDTAKVTQRGQLGVLAARAGDTATAHNIDRWLGAQPTDRARQAISWQARVALALGERERASLMFRQAMAKGLVPAFALHGVWELIGLDDDPVMRQLFAARRLN